MIAGVSLNFFCQSPAGRVNQSFRSPAGFFTSPYVFIHTIFKTKKKKPKEKKHGSKALQIAFLEDFIS